MNESEDGIVSEEVVERNELCGDGIRRGCRRPIAVKDHGKKNNHSAAGDRDTDNG